MSYNPIGDKTVQNFLDLLDANPMFEALSDSQKLLYINNCQQELANICKTNSLEPYRAAEDSANPSPSVSMLPLLDLSWVHPADAGETIQFSVTGLPDGTEVLWYTSNASIATVSIAGLATKMNTPTYLTGDDVFITAVYYTDYYYSMSKRIQTSWPI
jgi:hypothetical protein